MFSGTENDTFNNSGTFNFTAVASRAASVVFNNSGTLNVNSGTLTLARGGTNSGVINTFPAATLAASNFSNSGVINIRATSASQSFAVFDVTNTASGRINIAAGWARVGGTSATNQGEINIAPSATLVLDGFSQAEGSKISGSGTLVIQNSTPFAGLITSTGPVDISGTANFTTDQEIAGAFSLGQQVGGADAHRPCEYRSPEILELAPRHDGGHRKNYVAADDRFNNQFGIERNAFAGAGEPGTIDHFITSAASLALAGGTINKSAGGCLQHESVRLQNTAFTVAIMARSTTPGR